MRDSLLYRLRIPGQQSRVIACLVVLLLGAPAIDVIHADHGVQEHCSACIQASDSAVPAPETAAPIAIYTRAPANADPAPAVSDVCLRPYDSRGPPTLS